MTTDTIRLRGTARRPGPGPAAARRRVPDWYADVTGSLMWLSLLVVTALWVAGGGPQDLVADPGSGLISVGRLTGLLSADLLVIQVLLIARIPFVEQAYGLDELARRHRLIGFTSINLMLTHIAVTIIGYALSGNLSLAGQAWDLVANYPGMLLAAAATGLLLMVTITSMRATRTSMRYESWHLLHLYAYLGVGLAIPHEVWTGTEFISSPRSRLYWWSLSLLTMTAIVVWRLGVPVYRSLRHRIVVHRVVSEAPGVVSVYLRGRNLTRLNARAGQFFVWRFLDGPGWTRGHPYSLSAPPARTTMRITVKELGDGSTRLARVRPGTRVLIEGPYGRLHAGVRTRRRVTLLAGGIGVTPLRALLEELPYEPGEATLIYRARDTADLVLRDELNELADHRGARVFYVLGRRIRDRHSWLPETAAQLTDAGALLELVPDIAMHDVYLCGAGAWMDAACTAALAAGVPAENVHVERFAW